MLKEIYRAVKTISKEELKERKIANATRKIEQKVKKEAQKLFIQKEAQKRASSSKE